MSELAYCSAVAIAKKIRRREISSREAVDYFLARVAALDKPINSVVTIDAERARTEADAADASLARGEGARAFARRADDDQRFLPNRRHAHDLGGPGAGGVHPARRRLACCAPGAAVSFPSGELPGAAPIQAGTHSPEGRFTRSSRIRSTSGRSGTKTSAIPAAVGEMLGDESALLEAAQKTDINSSQVDHILHAARTWRHRLQSEAERTSAITALVVRVELNSDRIRVSIKLPIAGAEKSQAQLPDQVARSFPMQLKRRGVELRLIVSDHNRRSVAIEGRGAGTSLVRRAQHR